METQPILTPNAPNTPTIPPIKQSSSKGKLLLIGFFIIIALIYSGIFYFYLFNKKDDSPVSTFTPPVNQQVTTAIQQSPTLPPVAMQPYTNPDFAYSLSIPKDAKFSAAKNVDKALPDYFGSFNVEWNNNPQYFEINVFHNLGMNVRTLEEYKKWCKDLETQLAKSGHVRRPGCTANFSAKETTLHGYKAFKTTIPSNTQTVEVYYIPQKTYVYQLLSSSKNAKPVEKTVSDQILTSFTVLN